MTADQGYITCSFSGSPAVMEEFSRIAAKADRHNLFSCGLSWLDEIDFCGEAESDAVSYDTLELTREFLAALGGQLPDLEAEGRLEHSWPVLPCRQTVVEFTLAKGALSWDEHTEEQQDLPDDFLPDEDDDIEIEIPLTPYD